MTLQLHQQNAVMPITLATIDLGNWLNLRIGSYL
jgi:hypothetical protein